MFRKSITTAVLGIALLSTAALAKDDSKTFLMKAAQGGAAEIAHAKVALTMASNPDIQAFAKEMIADHEAAGEKIAALAKTHKLTLDTGLTDRQMAQSKRLTTLNDNNREFDREYLALTIKEHEKSIKAFKKQAKMGTDAEVRAFAKATLPKLKAHREHASTLRTRLDQKSNQ
jgi:putative membrane protein